MTHVNVRQRHSAHDGRAGAGSRRDAFYGVAALYALAVIVYAVLGHRASVPLITPDEFTYGHLARTLADGDGLTWRGQPVSLYSALYVYAIAPAWVLASPTTAYDIAKLAGALLVCLTVVPTWMIARPALGPRLALIPAALAVAGTWMTSTGSILTENLAYPLATAALAAMVMAVSQPGRRWGWLALVLSALAAWARLQCVALVPILALAILVRAAAEWPHSRKRLAADRTLLLIALTISVVGAVLVLADPEILGSYAGVGRFRPSTGTLLGAVGRQSLALVVMAGVLPIVVILAAAAQRSGWRDARLAPLLAVSAASTLVLVAQSGWAVAGFEPWHVQRYVQYALPVLFVTAAVAAHAGFVSRRRLVASSLVIAAGLLLAPPVRQVLEERATYALSLRADDVLGIGTPLALALTAVIAGTLAAALWSRRPALLILAAISGAILLVQDDAGWRWQIRASQAWRAGYPADRSWLDDSGRGEVARLLGSGTSSRWPITEFFNRRVTQVYAAGGVAPPGVRGAVCDWGVAPTGALTLTGCGTPAHRFLVDDYFGRVTFYGQHVDVDDPVVGRVVSIAGAPRVRSIVNVPCGRPDPQIEYGGRGTIGPAATRCLPSISVNTWLDRPGVVVLRFQGGDAAHVAAVGQRQYAIAPLQSTTVRIAVPAGASGFRLDLDWSAQSPALTATQLVQGSEVTSLL